MEKVILNVKLPLTVDQLKTMAPGVFAFGQTTDDSEGLNMTGSGKPLRWVASRGDIHDWTIYCHWADRSYEWIKNFGDKVHDERNIKNVIEVDAAAMELYRH